MVEPDDGVEPLIRELKAARCTIDVSIYLLSEETIIDTLIAAAQRGVAVRVMLEEHPFGGGGGQGDTRERLSATGIEVRWSGSQTRFSHAKYIVVDRQVAIIMNQNLTRSAFTNNRDFAVITTSPAEVGQAQAVFDRDWEHDAIDDPPGPLILSPTNSRERLLEIIDGATTTIDFYAEIIRDHEFVAALERAIARGVTVRLLVDRSMDETMRALLSRLTTRGLDVRISSTLYIHAKVMLVDGELVVVGSQNPTPTSLDDNREVSMIVTDPYALNRAAAIFARDWLLATPFGSQNTSSIPAHYRSVTGMNARQVNRFHSTTEPISTAAAQAASTTC